MDIEKEVKSLSSNLTKEIQQAAHSSRNEAEFRTKVTKIIENFAQKVNLNLHLREEYTLINGRADAVYNRLIIEYEPPRSLKPKNSYAANKHAINQLKGYIEGLVRRERHKPERVAGVARDGFYFIFVRSKEGVWYIDEPLKVGDYSAEYFLKLLLSLSTELALIPENLTRDFGENTNVSRKVVSLLFDSLTSTDNPKVKTLFEQWSLQFSEVCDYKEASKVKIESFARNFGVTAKKLQPFPFFFCLHTYYATFIKLLTVQVAQYYAMPKLGTDLKQATTFRTDELKAYFKKIEEGGIFRELGISNFIEGDFFSWYLDVWDDEIFQAFGTLISTLANYSLVTLDVDPDTTRDLLKKLYQQLMPRELRHNLGEYYTPDWLAERLINMLEGGKFEGNPDWRVLDPACGSGTFLVIVIKKIREYAWKRAIPESQVLEKILSNVVGFDLNPLAVISARTNYLLALGDLLQHRKGEINIPVYICDSIMTPQEGEDLFGKGILKFNTAVGLFSIPKSLVQARYIDELANLLEEAVRLKLDHDQFIERLCSKLPLNPKQDNRDIEVVYELYDKLISLDKKGINGVWARIIKNAFAPLFAGEFDYVAGNPPWINWEHLPENYRVQMIPLYENVYALFPHTGFRRRHGSSKVDISTLMTYVSLDKYLNRSGKLGFIITQSVFKTDAGKGFRKFTLPKDELVQVLHVDDMIKLKPFEGASNRTSVVIIQKGRPTKYPMPSYLYWRKTVKGRPIPLEATLDDVLEITERKRFAAEPVDEKDITSPWITGRPKALKGVKKILGKSNYKAHAGVCGWANSVYCVDIVEKRPDGLVIISNITEGAKREVESVQSAIEPDLLFPLLRGRDIKKWEAVPSARIIVPQDLNDPKHGYQEGKLKNNFPKTFLYLERFKGTLESRPGYLKYLKSEPWYSLYDIKKYTFAPYKVVWTRVAADIGAAVLGYAKMNSEQKVIVPIETATMVAFEDPKEAHYFCSILNSKPSRFVIISYSVEGTGGFGSPHILKRVRIPKLDSQNKLHLRLAECSKKAHQETVRGNDVSAIEDEIDDLAAAIWGLTKQELKDIKLSLEELQ